MASAERLADPASLGLDPAAIDALVARARAEVEAGNIPSCQLALARHGRLAAMVTLGAGATDETLFAAFSCTKGLMAVAAWQLVEAGLLDVAERVAAIVPEFWTNGKDAVTVEQLLMHTCGFPYAPFSPLEWEDRPARLARFARWRLDWEPGSRFVYHPTASMWVLAEVLERRTGLDYRDWIRERIARPLGLPELRVGIPDAEHGRIAEVVYLGHEATAEELVAAGWPAEMPKADLAEESMLALNMPAVRRVGLPGGGAITTAGDLALFYQDLVAAGGGRLCRPETVAAGRRVRSGDLVDPMTGVRVHRGLGVVVAGSGRARAARGFGPTGSAETFGHNGAGGQIAWGDPESGLSFAFLTNGFDRNAIRMGRRTVALSARAAACVRA